MKHLLILGILLIGLTCYSHAQNKARLPSNWKLVSGCSVSIYVPPDIKFVEDSLSDTCDSMYQSKNISININVTPFRIGAGEYSGWLEYCLVKTKINTKEAEIVTSYQPTTSQSDRTENIGLDYAAMLLVPRFREKGGNLIIRTWSRTSEERDNAVKILKSVQFDKN